MSLNTSVKIIESKYNSDTTNNNILHNNIMLIKAISYHHSTIHLVSTIYITISMYTLTCKCNSLKSICCVPTVGLSKSLSPE